MFGIKEQRGGGVRKTKYRSRKVLDPSIQTSSDIEDVWLKKNSDKIIERCRERNHLHPNTKLYPNSSWEKMLPKITQLKGNFSTPIESN